MRTTLLVVFAIVLAVESAPGSEERGAIYIEAPTLEEETSAQGRAISNAISQKNDVSYDDKPQPASYNDYQNNTDVLDTNDVSNAPQGVSTANVTGTNTTSFWDMIMTAIRASLGIQRREPPRLARTFLAGAAGRQECWNTTVCHLGKMMRKLEEKESFFALAELLVNNKWKSAVRGMRRAAVDDEDCRRFKCNV